MIACKHCETENSLDSTFCKSCGLEIPSEDREAIRGELQKLVTEGYALLGQNRTEEAALVAQKVLEDLPNSADALSLLGMCHERNDDLLAALQCYERVVELNPDSALDKIKVQSLRNALSRHLKEDRKPNRTIALIGAAAAIIVVASIGGIIATLVARPADATVANLDRPIMGDGAPFAAPPSAKTNPTNEATTTNPPVGQSDVQPIQSPGTSSISVPPLGRAGTTLPPVGSIGTRRDQGEAPINPLPSGIEVVPSGSGTAPRTNPDDPQPEGGTTPTTPPVQPKEDPNKGIEITIHKGQQRPVGGSEPIQDNPTGGLAGLMKSAQEQYLLGQYAKAAATYEAALRAGGDAGRVNQRIGQCYERIGKTAEAIAAYTRAEAALQASVSAGRTSAKATLDAVRSALRNLRGT
jgi:tetratricopeptide (TPR) repeat protein